MSKQSAIAPHESIEVHELLTFKNICLTKSTTAAKLVSDSELKTILQNDVSTTKRQIQELKEIMERSCNVK
ncbi:MULTISPECIES: spore coat protein [Clostridium]|uniref:Spore coat protein n=2 Tax=Clostridium TaxID=1485 RepID=A0ABM5NPP6_9CLOT|nr:MULTISPECIES: spore coat protein [Clostridium]ADK15017.1 putative spore coat protein [Clostridium ljungdahlii DSM 13528]AGY74269.1 hypothetical protein CAETHG_0032 [Clostridium autoethanogenum DSM 10061]ALU34460.1 Spore coat protein [Clostridium autoethanogenum DSM 10061]OAA87678.1 hypothetical protein WX45_03240 [Clostridium ljungdahlii DSM 13528]OVY51180.1 hypothetical protein WX72_02342 [Clostridium autoethanogenum]